MNLVTKLIRRAQRHSLQSALERVRPDLTEPDIDNRICTYVRESIPQLVRDKVQVEDIPDLVRRSIGYLAIKPAWEYYAATLLVLEENQQSEEIGTIGTARKSLTPLPV
ncbi:hypothetical protein M0L20_29555 [Spirosoma sp. RP8]|uniref:Uncharacterized protein n=1 Tax=Spirosoma liriopis TaxID=2937440 RepID=A0ABT0HV25_9BACT|nr:hypothetical protein [Spirosoma liriopis]MCK8496049.1 hypothetical protein [Spirosoma liriopis]